MGKIWNGMGREVPWRVPPSPPLSVITARYVLLIPGLATSFVWRLLGEIDEWRGGINDENNAFPCFILFHLTPGFLHWAVSALSIIFEGWRNGRKGGERGVTGVERYLTIMTLSTYGTKKNETNSGTHVNNYSTVLC